MQKTAGIMAWLADVYVIITQTVMRVAEVVLPARPDRQNDKDKVSRFMLNACQKSEFALWLDEFTAAKLQAY